MSGAWMRGRRVIGVAMAVLVLLTTAVLPARSAPTVYSFSLTYQGSCEGFTEGEIRVDGATVELWGRDGGELQKVGDGLRQPDDTFSISVPEAAFTMNGKLTDEAVSGTGTSKILGSSCTFNFFGRRVDAPATTLPTAPDSTEVERSEDFDTPEEELDAFREGPLSVGEIKNVLRRGGLDADEVDEFLLDLNRDMRTFAKETEHPELLPVVLGTARLSRATDGDGAALFPTLEALAWARPDSCDECLSPLGRLARGLTQPGSEQAVAFHRLVRLSLTLDLP